MSYSQFCELMSKVAVVLHSTVITDIFHFQLLFDLFLTTEITFSVSVFSHIFTSLASKFTEHSRMRWLDTNWRIKFKILCIIYEQKQIPGALATYMYHQ